MKNVDQKPPVNTVPVGAGTQNSSQKKPNDQGTVTVQAYMKIFDPNTKQTFVEGRA